MGGHAAPCVVCRVSSVELSSWDNGRWTMNDGRSSVEWKREFGLAELWGKGGDGA